jgi:FkbM family methyltransferase
MPRVVSQSTFHGQGRFSDKAHGGDPEDAHVFRHFFNRSGPLLNGTFVEMGAVDGVRFSNTLFFERELGWHGLLVEPSPRMFAALRRNRGTPRNVLVNAAVCDEPGEVEWWESGNPTVSSLRSSLSEEAVQSGTPLYGQGATSRSKITCRPFSALLAEAQLAAIDFFSLDVQGAEAQVLRTMDWSVPIGVLVIELDGANTTKDYECRGMLRARGMRFVRRMGYRRLNELWVGAHLDRRSSGAERGHG